MTLQELIEELQRLGRQDPSLLGCPVAKFDSERMECDVHEVRVAAPPLYSESFVVID